MNVSNRALIRERRVYLSGLNSSGSSQYLESWCSSSIGIITWAPLKIVTSPIVVVARQRRLVLRSHDNRTILYMYACHALQHTQVLWGTLSMSLEWHCPGRLFHGWLGRGWHPTKRIYHCWLLLIKENWLWSCDSQAFRQSRYLFLTAVFPVRQDSWPRGRQSTIWCWLSSHTQLLRTT